MKAKDFSTPAASLIGIHQVGFDSADTEEEIQSRTAQMIARSLNVRGVVAFVGSGISRAYGQPDWDTYARGLVEYTIEKIGHRITSEQQGALRSYIESTKHQSRTAQPSEARSPLARSDRTLVTLDLCDELFGRQGEEDHKTFRDEMARRIKPKGELSAKDDPLRTVIERLGIRRFLTTNYDLQIEDALGQYLDCAVAGSHVPREMQRQDVDSVRLVCHSLVQSPQNVEDLVRFAVATPGYECGVFHLHGAAADSGSMVVTERDYQRVYLQEGPRHRAFQEALEVAFAGNAILFLGTGMEESDLLRPLRHFVSEETRGGYERPLFALLPKPDDPATAQELRHYLYTRYGVKARYYPLVGGSDGLTASFCAAVEQLADDWHGWWSGWQKKPVVRKPVFRQIPRNSAAMVRHFTEPAGDRFDNTGDVRAVTQKLDSGAGAVVAMGRPGAGKGSVGQAVTTEWVGSHSFTRRFFATAHFSNDFLCMVDAAVDYLGAGSADHGASTAQRLSKALESGTHLLVIGGLERVLVPASLDQAIACEQASEFDDPVPVGEPLTQEVREFLELVKTYAARRGGEGSQIVLTTSTWPAMFDLRTVPWVRLRGVSTEIALADSRFGALDSGLVRELWATLRGHAYALAVVGSALEAQRARSEMSVPERSKWLRHVVGRLTAVDLDARAGRAVGMAADVLLRLAEPKIRGLLPGLLQRVTLFTTPVTAAAACSSYPQNRRPDLPLVQEALEYLQATNLLIRVAYEHGPSWRTFAHTLLRRNVLEKLGSSPGAPGEAQRFELTGWSNEVPDTLSGQGQGHSLVISSVDAVLATVETSNTLEPEERRHMIRAAFGLIRSRWTATAIPRLGVLDPEMTLRLPRPHYAAYQRRLARLLNAIRTTPDMPHWITESAERTSVEKQEGVLYADELAWLYHELGLVAFSEGLVPDAYALFRSGQHLNAVAERGFHGHRWCESQIDLGLVQMERGQLTRAHYHLESAVRASHKIVDSALEARARGHLGQVHHQMGNYDRAGALYDDAIGALEKFGNHRGVSIFRQSRGDLCRRLRDFGPAAQELQKSVAAAEAGRHPDLAHYARIATTSLRRAMGEQIPIDELFPATEFARRVGIPRLEWSALVAQAKIALDHGDHELAGRLAVSTLAIASSMGLRLRVGTSLILLGRATDARGNTSAARALISSGMKLAERQGNQLLIERAEEAIKASHSAEQRRSR